MEVLVPYIVKRLANVSDIVRFLLVSMLTMGRLDCSLEPAVGDTAAGRIALVLDHIAVAETHLAEADILPVGSLVVVRSLALERRSLAAAAAGYMALVRSLDSDSDTDFDRIRRRSSAVDCTAADYSSGRRSRFDRMGRTSLVCGMRL